MKITKLNNKSTLFGSFTLLGVPLMVRLKRNLWTKTLTDSPEEKELWERRRRNLNVIMAYQGIKPSPLAAKINLGVNTVTAFLNGKARPRSDTLEKICKGLGLNNVAMLDAENPMSVIRNQLFGLVQDATEDQAREALALLREHFPELVLDQGNEGTK